MVPKPHLIRDSHPLCNFFWIQQDLWESKSFVVKDFIPVQEGDMLRADWKRGLFTAYIWGKGELKSFFKAVGSQRDRGEEDQLGGALAWWNQGFPLGPFPPSPPQSYPSSFGFYPNPPPHGFGQGQFPFSGQHQY
jgi:hypothetical protein